MHNDRARAHPGPSFGFVLALAFVATLPVSGARAEYGGIDFADTGPLRIRDQFALNMGLLAFDPDSAEVLHPGSSRVELIETVTNTFAMSRAVRRSLKKRNGRKPVTLNDLRGVPGNVFYVDAEVYRTALSFDHQVSDRVQLGVTVQWLSFVGGSLDGLIESFHDTFNIGQGGRDVVLHDQFTVYTRSNGREVFDNDTPGTGFGDIVLSAKTALLASPRPLRLSVETTLKVPTRDGKDLFSSGSFDAGVQVLTSRVYEKSCIHAAVGLLYLGEWELLDLPAQTLVSGMLAYELGLGEASSLIAQLTASQNPFSRLDLPELAEIPLQISFGVKHQFQNRLLMFAALTENIANYDNTADIGFHLGLSYGFKAL